MQLVGNAAEPAGGLCDDFDDAWVQRAVRPHADLRHTMAWGGSANLCDESGQAIAGFKAISPTSGCDCVDAFPPAGPEPASAALMFAGLGCALNACAAPVGKTARLLEKVGD